MRNPVALLLALSALTPVALIGQTGYPDYPDYPDWEEPGMHGDYEYDDPQSPIGITDGTPVATTTQAATAVANDNAFVNPETVVEEGYEPEAGDEAAAATTEADTAVAAANPSSFGMEVGTGSYSVGDTDATVYTVSIPYSRKLSDRAKLSLSIPISITNFDSVIASWDSTGNLSLDDATVYGAGINAAYTYKVYDKQDNVPYRWNVTPSFGVFGRDSSDMNLGSWVFNGGFSSSFAYQFRPGWIVNMGNSVSYALNTGMGGRPDPVRDNQQVLINGIQVIRMTGRWTLFAYVMDTRMLQDTFVDSIETVAAGASFKLTRTRSIKASLIYETGNEYHSFRGSLGSTWRF